MRDSIIALGGSGVRVDYGTAIIDGKEVRITRRLDSVVRQNLLWGAKQASIAYNDMIGEELGCDGYEIDAHAHPRPSHNFMQGKQYRTKGTKVINGEKFIGFAEPDPASEEGLSAEEALDEYGCLHYKKPIICGVSVPSYTKEELAWIEARNAEVYEIGGKEVTLYEASQQMRKLETAVRHEKTLRDAARASGDNVLVKKCNARIKAYQSRYSDIAEITGIAEDRRRMSVPKTPIDKKN
jgi:hypothetical protein